LAAETESTIVVQVDGRARDRFTVPTGTDRGTLVELAGRRERVTSAIGGRPVLNVVAVPERLVNFVTRTRA